jgi:molybdenum cofactor cytidylyltransferase
LEAYWQQKSDLIAPSFAGQRGNPVLISRAYFEELLALPADAAPRHLLQKHGDALHLVPVASDAILRDLDLIDDYERWRPTGNKKAASDSS